MRSLLFLLSVAALPLGWPSAACAAAGKGSAEPPLDEPAKAQWRRQALEWLRGDLACGTRLVQTGLAEGKEFVSMRLRSWKADLKLAGVRDEDALYKLPETERRAWRAFWAEVDALIGAT